MYNTALAAGIHSLPKQLSNITLPYNNTPTIDATYSACPRYTLKYPPVIPTGTIEITSCDAILYLRDVYFLFATLANQYNREVRVDPDASMGTKEMTVIHGNAKLDLHPLTGRLTWRMWAGAVKQLGDFIEEDVVETFFRVFDDEMGYVGLGDVVYYDPSMSVATN
jgi:hypothetical protein